MGDIVRYALIVGANSGLAQSVINTCFNEDDIIFCADISYKENIKDGNIHYINVDVTNNESIKYLYNYVKEYTDKLDIVSNFAGIVTLGSLVELPLDTLDRIVSINLNSQYKINNIFFEMVLNAKGRFIIISSEYAKICGIPFHGYYGITKTALDVYIDSFRREVSGLGVKVIGIRPGAFKTSMQKNIDNQFSRMVDQTNLYKEPLLKMKHIMDGELLKAKDPKHFAKIYNKALNKRKPKRYYNVKNSFKMKLLTILPACLQDYAFKKFLK